MNELEENNAIIYEPNKEKYPFAYKLYKSAKNNINFNRQYESVRNNNEYDINFDDNEQCKFVKNGDRFDIILDENLPLNITIYHVYTSKINIILSRMPSIRKDSDAMVQQKDEKSNNTSPYEPDCKKYIYAYTLYKSIIKDNIEYLINNFDGNLPLNTIMYDIYTNRIEEILSKSFFIFREDFR